MANSTHSKRSGYTIHSMMYSTTRDRLYNAILGYINNVNKFINGNLSHVVVNTRKGSNIEIIYSHNKEVIGSMILEDLRYLSESYIMDTIVNFTIDNYYYNEFRGIEIDINTLGALLGMSERDTQRELSRIIKKSRFYINHI